MAQGLQIKGPIVRGSFRLPATPPSDHPFRPQFTTDAGTLKLSFTSGRINGQEPTLGGAALGSASIAATGLGTAFFYLKYKASYPDTHTSATVEHSSSSTLPTDEVTTSHWSVHVWMCTVTVTTSGGVAVGTIDTVNLRTNLRAFNWGDHNEVWATP